MTVLADWVHRPITKNIVFGVILSLLSVAGIVASLSEFELCMILLFVLIGIVCITVFSCVKKTKVNREETPPICAKEQYIFLYNGTSHVEIPIDRIVKVIGKNKRYFHFYVYFFSWGTYNYGKVSVCFLDENRRKRRFVIPCVLKPEDVPGKVTQYMQNMRMEL